MIKVNEHIIPLKKKYGWKWSSYAYWFKYTDRNFILNSLTSELIEIEKLNTEKIINHSFNQSEKRILKESKLIYDNYTAETEKDLVDSIKGKIAEKLLNTNITTLFIIATDTCNLQCTYCYENLENYTSKTIMSYDVMKNSIENVIKYSCEPIQIFFYGGEPLLNWKNIKKTIKYVNEEYSQKAGFQIITNGTLYIDELIDFSKKYNIGLAISLDGTEKINNSARIARNKDLNVYNAAIALLKKCQQNNINHSVLCTVSVHNKGKLLEISKFFVEKLQVDEITFNLQLKQPQQTTTHDMKFWNKLGEEVANCNQYFNSKGINESRSLRYISGLVENSFTISECDAGYGTQIVVRPDGKIGPCQGFLHNENYWVLFHEKLNEIRKNFLWKNFYLNHTLSLKKCQTCPLIGTCGGGCHYNRQSLNKPNETFCQYMLSFIYHSLINL